MQSWKKALVLSSFGTSAFLLLRKRWPAGVLSAGVALALLASEYPEKFEKVQNVLPDYFERGMRLVEMAQRAGQRIAQYAERGTHELWDEISS